MLIGRERTVATSSLKIWIAAPVIDAYRHESAVLAGEHTLLEIGKATGVGHWLAVPIVDTRLVLTTSGRIDQL